MTIHFGLKPMIVVKTAVGKIPFAADMIGKCPSCKSRVLLCRDAPFKQWVPVIPRDNYEEVHDLHVCLGERVRNASLRHYAGIEEYLPNAEEDLDGA